MSHKYLHFRALAQGFFFELSFFSVGIRQVSGGVPPGGKQLTCGILGPFIGGSGQDGHQTLTQGGPLQTGPSRGRQVDAPGGGHGGPLAVTQSGSLQGGYPRGGNGPPGGGPQAGGQSSGGGQRGPAGAQKGTRY